MEDIRRTIRITITFICHYNIRIIYYNYGCRMRVCEVGGEGEGEKKISKYHFDYTARLEK